MNRALVCWLERCLVGVCLILLLTPCAHAQTVGDPAVQILDRAHVALRLQGQETVAPTDIALPLHWDVDHRRSSGWADLRVHFDLTPAARQEPHAVLIERLGNAYRVSLNGAVLAEGRQLDRPGDGWAAKRPLYLVTPASLLRERNELRIELRADIGRRAGLSVVRVGPTHALAATWRDEELMRIGLPQAASVLSGLAAALCLLLWFQQRDRLYAFAALGEAAWGLRVMDTWWEASLLPWPDWALVVLALFWLWTLSLYQMAVALWNGRPRWERWTIAGLLALAPPLVLVGYVQNTSSWVIVWMALSLLVWALLGLRLAWQVVRQPDWARGLMAASVLACTAAIVRDTLAGRADAALYADIGWSKAVAACLALSIIAIVSLRFKRSKDDLLALQHSLEQRLLAREQALSAQHEALRTLERTAATAQERARILRDMHDGAGAHLITAIRQLESGVAGPQQVAQVIQTLRESLDQLRLSIDAMNLPPGDVNALLASLRFRMGPRLTAAGLQLVWAVDALPYWPQGSEEGMRHLQYIVFEAVSNALQHAEASEITLSAHANPSAITIALRDDGRGYDGQRGNGVRSLHERAALIGAQLSIQAAAPGTRVQVVLPLEPVQSPLVKAQTGL